MPPTTSTTLKPIGVVPISQLQVSLRQPTATLAPESDWLRLPLQPCNVQVPQLSFHLPSAFVEKLPTFILTKSLRKNIRPSAYGASTCNMVVCAFRAE